MVARRVKIDVCFKFLVGLLFAYIVSSCANIVSPTGGPKDTTPPKIVQSAPGMGATEYTKNSISISFDEFVQAPTLSQDLLVSPPLKQTPTVKFKGKTLILQWDDTLKSNVTYIFDFGDAVKDITENNVVEDLKFHFSTGIAIDSLFILGHVANSWDGKVEDNIHVMLFPYNISDSALAQTPPQYVTKADKDGKFTFSFVKEGEYLLAALSDRNNNLRYDLITEPFAFYPKPVIPGHRQYDADTTDSDTTLIEKDQQISYKLNMFVGNDSIQKIMAVLTEGRHRVTAAFRFPVVEPKVNILSPIPDSVLLGFNWAEKFDTLDVWLKDNVADSLIIAIDARNYSDTAKAFFRSGTVGGRGGQKKPAVGIVMTIPKRGYYTTADTPSIIFSQPLINMDYSQLKLITTLDTLQLNLEPANKEPCRKYYIVNRLDIDSMYKILIPERALQGIDKSYNDSTHWEFGIKSDTHYGTIKVIPLSSINNTDTVLIYLMNEKSVILSQHKTTNGKEVVFPFLKPGDYFMQSALDKNNNGRWDTGDYYKKQQPEPVIRLKTPINVKEGWTEEIEWNMKFDN